MNYLIIALGSLILGCAIYVSYNHTIELFVVHGTPYVHAIAATVTVELIFVLSALIIVVGKLKHRPIGFIGTAGFLYGASISGWANVSYYASHGISGWLIGLAIPLGVLISESMVTKAITEFSKSKQTPTNREAISPTSTQQENSSQEKENRDRFSRSQESPTKLEKKRESSQSSKLENRQENAKTPTPKKPGEGEKELGESKLEKVALQYLEENGELPSRRKLMELTGEGEWSCRKVLSKLKKKAG